MVLNEKRNEQNQQNWLSHAKRERMNLSASVEEALGDSAVDEISWGEEPEEGQAGFPEREQGKGVFPPRLSLQSRPIPALRTEISKESYGSAYPVVPSEQERKSAASTQNTNILKRFAQRLTSSFAAIGGAPQPEVIEPLRQFPEEERVRLEGTALKEVDENIQQIQKPAVASLPQEQEKAASQRPTSPESIDEEPRDKQSKLAGRTTRIHLETPPVTAATRSRRPEEVGVEKSYGDPLQKNSLTGVNEPTPQVENDTIGLANAASVVGVDVPKRENATGSSLPAMTRQMPVGVSTTSTRLPAVDALKGKSGGATRRELSGSGIFEPGQGDAIVVNRYVTEASVVLVTLTANPGPVVVQYVTLRPRIGFTVHLTAPTTMRASFNYIVLLGELF